MKKVLILLGIVMLLLGNLYFVFADTQDDFLTLINNERVSLGKQPLSLQTQLTNAATLHSQDMIDKDYFSHTSQDGRTYIQRLVNAGYVSYTAAGENIGYHSGSPNASAVFEMWKNSSGHYNNMISDSFTEMGLGVATGDYTGFQATMYTLDLGRRSGVSCTEGNTETQQCGSNIGECKSGTQTRNCVNGLWSSWSACTGGIEPTAEICGDSLDSNCDGQLDSGACIPMIINILSPNEAATLSSSTVKLNVSMNKKSKITNIYDNGRKITYCTNCGTFSRNLYLSAGNHTIIVESFDEYNNSDSKSVNFYVYLPNLRIISTKPASSTYPIGTNSNFSVTYTSSSPIKAILTIKHPNYEETLEQNCGALSRGTCSFYPNILENMTGSAVASFKLEDNFGYVVSKNITIRLDTADPEMSLNWSIRTTTTTKYITLKGKSNERVAFSYIDSYGINRRICSSCTSFTKSIYMKVNNTLSTTITSTDLAGNSITQDLVI